MRRRLSGNSEVRRQSVRTAGFSPRAGNNRARPRERAGVTHAPRPPTTLTPASASVAVAAVAIAFALSAPAVAQEICGPGEIELLVEALAQSAAAGTLEVAGWESLQLAEDLADGLGCALLDAAGSTPADFDDRVRTEIVGSDGASARAADDAARRWSLLLPSVEIRWRMHDDFGADSGAPNCAAGGVFEIWLLWSVEPGW